MAVNKIREYVDMRDDIAGRLAALQLIMERDEIEIKLVSTAENQETYPIQIRKKDFETTLTVQIEFLSSELIKIDLILDKWTTEISK